MVEEVIKIVREAAEIMQSADFKIEQKCGVENIVTSSDIAVQHYLCEHLAKLLPEAGFICEEEDFSVSGHEYQWVIDPIDGTANYARGIIECCISVGMKKGDDIILGVVYSPARGELYHAEKGKGAFCNGRPVRSSGRSFKEGLFCAAMSTYRKEYAEVCKDIIMETYYQCNDFRRFGSAALELCYMAAGKIDLYFEMRLQPWDYAAGGCILREAGGDIRSFGTPLLYDRPCLVIAANDTANLERLDSIVHNHLKEIPYID